MSTPPDIGEEFLGKYRVERVIGRGGMGVVIAARHLHLERTVAIKFLLPEMTMQPDSVPRFIREARATVSIESEHVVRVLDVGATEQGVPYMVMEFLQGRNLSELLRERKRLAPHEAAGHVLQACEALVEAHRLGIVHRDLKPANLFLARQADGAETIKVLDFGISKLTGGGQEGGLALTATTAVMGSPLYMSPEQMRSAASVGPATDIWALGVILFELLSGQTPFNGTTLTEVLTQVLSCPTPSLGALCPELPEGLERVVARCLEKDPAARPANIAELAVELAGFAPAELRKPSLDRILRVHRSAAYPATEPGQMPELPASIAGTAATIGSAPPLASSRARSALGPGLGVAAALVLVAAAVAVMLWRSGSGTAMPQPDASNAAPASSSTPVHVTVLPEEPAASTTASATAAPEPDSGAPREPAPSSRVPKKPAAASATEAPVVPPTTTGRKNPLNVDIK
jgi:serine/threonine-protein kinase